jgi:hypothetical protein
MWAPRESGDAVSGTMRHHPGPVIAFLVAWSSSMALVVAALLTGGEETVPTWLAIPVGAALVAASSWLYCAVRDDDL